MMHAMLIVGIVMLVICGLFDVAHLVSARSSDHFPMGVSAMDDVRERVVLSAMHGVRVEMAAMHLPVIVVAIVLLAMEL